MERPRRRAWPAALVVAVVAFGAGSACSAGGEGPVDDTGQVTQATFGDCQNVAFEGRTYRFCSNDRSWASARSDCQAAGMDLVSIQSAGENTFVTSNLTGASWIGAQDADAEGVWKWSDGGAQFWQGDQHGGPFAGAFARWKSGEPNDFAGQDCARIGGDGTWSDESCSGTRDYVCEGEGAPAGQPPDTSCQGAVFRGVEYWFCTNDRTWDDARDRCRSQPGVDLASITSAEVQSFVAARIHETSWLGGNDRRSEGEWRFAERPLDDGNLFWLGGPSGKPVLGGYASWDSGEPGSSSNSDCQSISLGDKRWEDDRCETTHAFVCQGSADGCPADAAKNAPGICGCGVPDVDTDRDGTMDCEDQCPADPLRVTPGTCGCVGKPGAAPANTPCSDGLCSANALCDGAGRCGSPAQCAPHSSCRLETFRAKAYWFCSSGVAWTTARTRCGGAQRTAFLRIDDQYENAFVYSKLGSTSFIGANDLSTEGRWRWATATSNDGAAFWTGTESGSAPRGVYANWESAEPDVLPDCAAMEVGEDGEWENRSCSELRPYVCETCVRTTCAAEGAECGVIPDACGGTLDCNGGVGCPAGEVCFAAANRCSKPDGKDCSAAIKPDFSLPVHERILQLNREYAACGRPDIDECQVELLARVRTDRQRAAGLCLGHAIDPSLHNTIEFDRADRKRKARTDPGYACRLKAGDGDHDLVPDGEDHCPDTLPLMPVDDFGCDDPARLPGPHEDVMEVATGIIDQVADPACDGMGVPSTPIPDSLVAGGTPGGTTSKGIIMGAVHHPPGCQMFYEIRIDAELVDGTEQSYHLAWAEEEATSAGYGGRNGLLAVLFQARSTDPAERGAFGAAQVRAAHYSVRARNKSGVASPWSRYVQMGNEPLVGAWGRR